MVMKVLGAFQGDDQVEFFQVVPPCAGYYTNFRMQCLSAESVTQQPFAFYFGTNMDRDVFDRIIDANEFNRLPDVNNNAFFKTYSYLDTDPGGVAKFGYTYHWGNKKVHVDHDSLVNVYTKLFLDANANNHWVITADFVPKKGAKMQIEQEVLVTAEGDDWQTEPIYIPETLENCIVELVITGAASQVAAGGTVKLRKFDPNDEILTGHSFAGTVRGDILVPGAGIQKHGSDKNTLINLDYSFVVGGNNMAEETKGVPILRRGQILATDFDSPIGATTSPLIKVRISGFIKYQSKSTESFFLQSTELLNGNAIEMGLVG